VTRNGAAEDPSTAAKAEGGAAGAEAETELLGGGRLHMDEGHLGTTIESTTVIAAEITTESREGNDAEETVATADRESGALATGGASHRGFEERTRTLTIEYHLDNRQ